MNIKNIAELAQVSVSTVSRVMNHHPDVKEDTRERVLQVIRENNYIPNNSARVLKQSTTSNIGVLVKGVFNPFFSEMIKIISIDVEKAGYTMILQHHSNENDIETLFGFIKEKKLQGVICLGGNFLELDDEQLARTEAAIVLVSVDLVTRKNLKHCSSISIDNKTAAYTAVSYLLEKGHHEIGLMLGDLYDIGIGKQRYEGYRRALEVYEVPFHEEYVVYGQYECDRAYAVTKELLQKHPQLTAIFCISDLMAISVAKAVSDLGYKLGENHSVIGFDGMDMALYYEPSITTMMQPRQEMGTLSVKLLLDVLERKRAHEHIFLDVELIEGASCQFF